jgi:hypothetical protein
MIRSATLLCFGAAIASAGFLFVVAHQAQQREREIDRISRSIRQEREAILVLEAEWAYLNQLERLQKLGARHLGLAPMRPEHLVRFGDLPMRPPERATADSVVPGRPPPAGAGPNTLPPNTLPPGPLASGRTVDEVARAVPQTSLRRSGDRVPGDRVP